MSDSMTVAQAGRADLTVRHGMTPAEAEERWSEVIDVVMAARAVGDADALVRFEQLIQSVQQEPTMQDVNEQSEQTVTEKSVTEKPDERTESTTERTSTTVRDEDTDSDE